MYIVVFCSFLALLFTLLESRGHFKGGMKYGFIIITFLGAIHYNYGTDYMGYYNVFQEIKNQPFNFSNIMAGNVYREPGWTLLNYLFKNIGGFFMLVIVLNILQNTIVYRIIKNEVDIRWWPLAIFIYLFETSFYLLSFSMMRQELVIIIFLGLWPWIKRRRYILCCLILFACYFIHTSALILIPFAFWGFMPHNNLKMVGLVYILFLIILWTNLNYVQLFTEKMLQVDEFNNYYSLYEEGLSFKLSLGFLLNMLPLFVSVYYILKYNKSTNYDEVLVILLAMVAFIIVPFSQIVRMISRVGAYFLIYSIIALPIVYSSLKNNLFRSAFVSVFVLIKLYEYFLFFFNPTWVKSYSTFHSIFEVL